MMQLFLMLIIISFLISVYAIFKGINKLVDFYYTPEYDEKCRQKWLLKKDSYHA
ncbi:MAG: hypothetical protein V2A75_00895 [Pseudomonadota bacterium]